MGRKLEDAVVVVTGASGGIGRATALAFADEAARVVLAARRREALEEVGRECEARGGEALVVPTDVSEERQVVRLAQQAEDAFGRLDVWVNNAGVSLFAPFEEAPPEAFRRVVETNYFGYVHGARAALRSFRRQGSGVLVNVSSVVAQAPQPYTSAYVSSKFAIRGLSDSIRMELELDGADRIHVCHLMPASIDTPLFHQAANYTGRSVKALDPAHPPERVAHAIVRLTRRPTPELTVGGPGRPARTLHALAPRVYRRIAARVIARDHFLEWPAEPTDGNLFEPAEGHAGIRGGWAGEPAGRKGRRALGIAAGLALVALPLALGTRAARRR